LLKPIIVVVLYQVPARIWFFLMLNIQINISFFTRRTGSASWQTQTLRDVSVKSVR
jgi:hypothetical protein